MRAPLKAATLPRRLGKGKQPWTQPNAMVAAMNTGNQTSFSARRFCNILLDMGVWAAVTISGSARTGTTFVPSYAYTGAPNTWTQNQGTLFGDGDGTGTDSKYFRGTLSSTAYGLPDGTYTVLNPCGLEFAIGTFGNPTSIAAWSSAKYRTFTYTSAGGAGIMIWFRQQNFANTGAGNVQIVRSGGASGSQLGDGTIDTTNGVISSPGTFGYTSGNPWSPDFLAFHVGLKSQHLRWMASNGVNTDVSQDFSDRVLPTSMTYLSQFLSAHSIPYELIADFSNRTGIDPWISFPPQATSDYVIQTAALFSALLHPNRRILPEWSNETWNFNGSFGVGANIMAFAQYTKHYATVSDISTPGAPVFLAPAHGRSVGDVLTMFPTRENAFLGTGVTFTMSAPYFYTISAVPDANHFTLNLAAFGRVIPTGLVNIMYAWMAEPGFANTTAQADINHGLQQAIVWDAFDAALGRARVVHSMGSQAANASHTSGRVGASAGTIARTEHVHVAPYYNGLYWAAEFDGTGGSITPRVWNSVGGTAWWGVYTSGSVPSTLDVVNQSGTGFIGGGGTTGTALASSPAANPSPALPAVSGLTDGTNYAAFIVFQETTTGYFWKIGTGTDALNPANVLSTNASIAYVFDSAANQAARARANGISNANYAAHVSALAGVGSSASVISYEGGPDMNLWTASSYALPQIQLSQWILNYLTSTGAVASLKHNYNHLARVGYKNFTYFLDVQGGGQYAPVQGAGVYDFINNQLFSNTTDPRYTMLASYAGSVAQQTLIPAGTFSGLTATPITSAPGAYPYTVATLPAGYTYALVNGDWSGNFSVSGLNVVMNNSTGVNYATFAPRTLILEASDAYSSIFFSLTVPLGSAWWESDAQFVWDSVGASAGTSMTPPTNPPFTNFGSALAEITGSGNPVITSSSGTVSNDLWKMATYVFANTSGLTQTVQTNVPFMVAHVVDAGDQATTFQFEIGIGAGTNSISWGVTSSVTTSRWKLVVNNVALFSGGLADIVTMPSKGTKSVHWMYVDPVNGTAIAGVNQTPNSGAALSGLSIGAFTLSRDVRIGNSNGGTTSQSQMYHGSLEFISRAGLTQSQVLTIVQNMQTHHGI